MKYVLREKMIPALHNYPNLSRYQASYESEASPALSGSLKDPLLISKSVD
jgi:hypothetical protein